MVIRWLIKRIVFRFYDDCCLRTAVAAVRNRCVTLLASARMATGNKCKLGPVWNNAFFSYSFISVKFLSFTDKSIQGTVKLFYLTISFNHFVKCFRYDFINRFSTDFPQLKKFSTFINRFSTTNKNFSSYIMKKSFCILSSKYTKITINFCAIFHIEIFKILW